MKDLDFDFSKRFLPLRLCGHQLPDWMTESQQHVLNHIRGFSYAHVFFFVEEFIIAQTCETAVEYVHQDIDALSAVLKFADEETKHQRMFAQMKARLSQGLGFEPDVIQNKEAVARDVCAHSDFAVYLLCLVLEWMTQRHYLECFQEEEKGLDPGFVKIFRLHWTEEAQHARLDALLLKDLAAGMDRTEFETSVDEFVELLITLSSLLRDQDSKDIESFELACGSLSPEQREELLVQLHEDWLWTFITSGLHHKSFMVVYNRSVPDGMLTVEQIFQRVSEALPEPSTSATQA